MGRSSVVVVGAGFAGFEAARGLGRLVGDSADVVLVNPTDYFLYLPLLPEVAGGVLDPRRVTVPLADELAGVRLVLGEVDDVDVEHQRVSWTGPEGERGTLRYDRLVLAAGSVNKLLPVPGVADHAHGFRGIPEALHLRDHLIRQVELAAQSTDADERRARCTFVAVGAGYTGTEVTAQGQLLTRSVAQRYPSLASTPLRWVLVDTGDGVLHGMDSHLRRTAGRVLRERGVELRTGTSLTRATVDGVELSDGDVVASRTLVWCVGVRPDPLAAATGLPMRDHRLEVDRYLNVTGHPEVFAAGDGAAVPDPDNGGEPAPMTAQHAVREGRLVARNLAASLGVGSRRPYRHRNLGFLVDLGGRQAAANPLHVPLSGLPAWAVTRAYHLAAMPGNRVHTAADWLSAVVAPRPPVQLGLVPGSAVPLDTDAPELPHPT